MENPHDRQERTIYVSMLPPNITDDQLYDLFLKAGCIEKVVFKKNNDGTPHHALVVFKNLESVRTVMDVLYESVLSKLNIQVRPLRKSKGVSADYLNSMESGNTRPRFASDASNPSIDENTLGYQNWANNAGNASQRSRWSAATATGGVRPNDPVFHEPLYRRNRPVPLARSFSNPKCGSVPDSLRSPLSNIISPPLSAGFLGICGPVNTRSAFPMFSDDASQMGSAMMSPLSPVLPAQFPQYSRPTSFPLPDIQSCPSPSFLLNNPLQSPSPFFVPTPAMSTSKQEVSDQEATLFPTGPKFTDWKDYNGSGSF